ncbi:MAG: CBS and ACT domain-containing protein [Pseudomonadota bacterium]
MRVRNWMVKKVTTISKDASVQEALRLMQKYSIRHMPVVGKKDSIVGLVTESNLRQFLLLSMVEKISVRDVMIVNPITIDADDTIEQAASLIYRRKIGCLPVVQDGSLVGIITVTDILGAFIEIMGLLRASSRIDLAFKNKEGSIDDITKTIKEKGGEIISIGIQGKLPGKRIHNIRLEKTDLGPIVTALEEKGYEIVSVAN